VGLLYSMRNTGALGCGLAASNGALWINRKGDESAVSPVAESSTGPMGKDKEILTTLPGTGGATTAAKQGRRETRVSNAH